MLESPEATLQAPRFQSRQVGRLGFEECGEEVGRMKLAAPVSERRGGSREWGESVMEYVFGYFGGGVQD